MQQKSLDLNNVYLETGDRIEDEKYMPLGVSLQEGGNTVISAHPDHCPICHSKVAPIKKYGRAGTFRFNASIEIIYVFPNSECNGSFIAYFRSIEGIQGSLSLIRTIPIEPVPMIFEDPVKQIPQAFATSKKRHIGQRRLV